jgi:hypothetical protein
MRRKIAALLLFALAAAPAHPKASAAAEKVNDYNAVVRLVEQHYRVKHRGLPFVADASMKTARVVSSSVRKYAHFAGFKLAVFEDQAFEGDHQTFHTLMRRTLEPAWAPLVVVRGAGEGQTYTYTREDAGKFKVLICFIGERDGTVLQVELNEQEFARLLLHPEQESKEITDAATNQSDRDDN